MTDYFSVFCKILISWTFFNREHKVKFQKIHLCRGHGSFHGRKRRMMAFSSVASQCEERGLGTFMFLIRGGDFEITDTIVPARTIF